ncbi:MAG TPA: signal peptidase I, partial [bacterium]|nr:signal peptidase I [bacterium]
ETIRKKHWIREYGEAILTAFLVAFVIRSFGIEAFKIPSGSMIPTLMIGDHIFVNKFVYGLRIPFTKKRIVTFSEPKRGEAIVFMYPLDESKDFIKRAIGLPGDRIAIHGDEVTVNGLALARQPVEVRASNGDRFLTIIPEAVADQVNGHEIPAFPRWESYAYFVEKVGDVNHLVQFDERPSYAESEFEVPAGHLFVMGDNRDNSSDSREWGFVPMENVKGRAMFVWLSLDYDEIRQGLANIGRWIRWDRFGKWIQ